MKQSNPLKTLLRLVLKENPSSLVWLVISGVVSTAQILFMVSIPKLLIDAYLAEIDYLSFLRLIAIIVGLKLLLAILTKVVENHQQIDREMIKTKYARLFSDKIMSIDYAYLEDPEMLELRERSIFALLGYRALDNLFLAWVDIVTGVFTLASVTVILIRFNLLIFFVVAALSMAAVLLSLYGIRQVTKLTKNLIPVNRLYNYYFGQARNDTLQKDFRMYDIGQLIVRLVKELNEDSNRWLIRMRRLQGGVVSWQGIIQTVTTMVVMVYAAFRTQGKWGAIISVADFTLFVGIASQFSQSFLKAMKGVFSNLQAMEMLQPLVEYMETPDSRMKSGECLPRAFESLEFRHVSFTYPGSDRLILDDVSFRIERGEHISIVGVNNAGKTTIVKLICRLFEPDQGEILYNDRPIQEYDYQEYLALLATVFQDFQFLPLTLKQNLGDDKSEQDILETLEMVEMREKVEQLPHQLDSYLFRQLHEEGVDFSGGERQKLAIARSILKNGELMILDEPTAALDPFAESEIYEHFSEMVKGKTTIFISHRMSSSLFCDKILLLDKGRVAAFDSHHQLMKSDNLYRTLFLTQAEHYQN